MISKNIKITFEEIYNNEGLRSAMLFLEKQGVEKDEIVSLCEEYNEKNSDNKSSGDSFSPDVSCECGSIKLHLCKEKECSDLDKECLDRLNGGFSGTTMGDLFNESYGSTQEIPLSDVSYSKSVSQKKPNFIKRLFGFK